MNQRIETLSRLGMQIAHEISLSSSTGNSALQSAIQKATAENPWFTHQSVTNALEEWSRMLREENVSRWLNDYQIAGKPVSRTVGVINAGNIPFAGLHDLLSVYVTGHNYLGKNATGDSFLLPYVAELLKSVDPSSGDRIKFIQKLPQVEAVIATGNNNSSRYFEYYFSKYPNIIRRNRNGAAILNGSESSSELNDLGKDIFEYFGMGCRNVSKLYVPAGYRFDFFFESIFSFGDRLMNHNKYMNNFEYNNSVLLLKQIPFLQNGFLIVRNETQIASPISILHYEEYDSPGKLAQTLAENDEQFQCIATNHFPTKLNPNKVVRLGKTQSPQLWDYADGVDTLDFLIRLG